MSILIDRLIAEHTTGPQSQSEHNGFWYIPKPLFIKESLWFRLKEAWKVLVGDHAFVYHYKKDEEVQ